ncbi:MAG TPA: hypothetical protein VH189_15525 [Rhizomicrobium sp.]|jgi:hypothetical protein|nr:hypothetical protein [Rhizomicrobium sp.]
MQMAILQYARVPLPISHYRLATQGGGNGGGIHGKASGQTPLEGEDLAYKVEVWNEDRTAVDQIVAMTANGSIGYAAYYEATKEYPHHYVTLRHKNRIVARWNPLED